MNEYESLRGDIEQVAAAVARYAGAVNTHVDAVRIVTDELWKDNAELRDELHALANRVETLTRARLTEPAEVAERIIPTNTPHKDRFDRAVERFRKEGQA